jgi:hypothetical protein
VVVAPGAAYNFVPADFVGMAAGFQGSAVVASNQPIKSIVNVTNRQSGGYGVAGGKGAAQYQGVENAATTLYFPVVKGNHFGKTTTYYIQNAGTQAATATANFTMRNGDVHTLTTDPIGPNQMVLFSIFDTATYSPLVNDAKVGSLVVTSTEPLAGIYMEYIQGENPGSVAQSTRAFTAADFGDTVFAPGVKNTRFNRFTGIQVQNVSGGPIDVTVTYKGAAGTCVGQTYTDTATGVAAGTAKTFNQLPGQTNLPSDCVAAATVVATGNIVASLNESYVSAYIALGNDQRAVASFLMPESQATTKISAPAFKDNRFSKTTGLQIMNVGASQATNVVATFVCGGAASFTAVSTPQTIPAGGAFLFFRPSTMAAGTFASPFSSGDVVCSVTVTADQPVVAIANEAVTPGVTSLAQDNNNYEAFNLVP